MKDDLLPAPPAVEGFAQRFLDPRVAFSARLEGAFEAAAEPAREDGAVRYAPALFADLALRFDEDRVGFVVDERMRRVWFPLGDAPADAGRALALEADDFSSEPVKGGRFSALPEWADEATELRKLQKRATDEVYRTETRGMFVNKKLKLYGRAEETRDDFEARCKERVEEEVDEDVAALKERYEKKADRLDDRLEAKAAKLTELEGVVNSRRLEEAVNVGVTVLGYLGLGRKRSVTSAVSRRRQSARAAQRVDQLEGEIERLEEDAKELEEELEEKVEEIREKHEACLEAIEEREVRLEKTDIQVVNFGILWVPVTRRV